MRGNGFCRNVGLCVAMLTLSSSTALAESQGWLNNSATAAVTEKFSVTVDQESRYREATYFGDAFLRNIQLGLSYKLPANTYLAIRYKREDERKTLFTSHENRVVYEGGWAKKLISDFRFDTRLRLEARNFEQDSLEDHLRYRMRIRFRRPMQVGSLELQPFIATELFGDNKESTDTFINRNRFYVGTAVPVSGSVSFIVNYIRQDTKDKEEIHVLNTGISVRI